MFIKLGLPASVMVAGALGIGSLVACHDRGSATASRVDDGTATAEPAAPTCPEQKTSALATKYLEHLHGIEIGASTQNSLKLKRSINVDFSDEQGGLWQDKNCEPATVIRPGGYIFIIAPHKDRTFDKARKVTPQPIRSPKTRLTC